ncbi:hypothetical protein Q7P37_006283 [Cladosporium fusiforme]
MSTVAVQSNAMEKPKKTKSRTGCRMCKTKRLKCDESKPACNQCVRRGRLCPGYKREIKWSTISTLTGKTRPPAERAQNANVEVIPPPPQNDAASGLPNQPEVELADGQNYMLDTSDATYTNINDLLDGLARNADAWGDAACQTLQQDPVSVEDNVSTLLEPEDEWPEWNGDSDLFNASVDGMDQIDTLSTDVANLPTIFECSPPEQADHSALIHARKASVATFPSPNPVDLPTTLIEYWFTHVCSMWCAFDSPQNWYRNLAGDTWHSSEPVYYALQAMSASVLVDSLPHIKQCLPTLTMQAAQAIQRAVDTNTSPKGDHTKPLPADLLLAVMGMGTSICWADPRQLGFWFLDKARGLLKQYGDDSEMSLDAPGRQTIEYFRQALIYWEMLANVVTKDYQNILRARRSKFKKRIRRAMSMEGPDARRRIKSASTEPGIPPRATDEPWPHPWTGVSGDIQQTFGLVMGLCQNRCVARTSEANLTADNLCDALCDIELAHDLEKELLAFNFNDQPVRISTGETGDPNAPLSHLVDTAEAYRLASLLHLYLAFSDLAVKFVRGSTSPSPGEEETTSWVHVPATMQRDHALMTLTLQLVDVLKRVPSDSGARCIQPILLISAAAGLRFDIPASTPNTSKAPSNPIHARGTLINQSAFSSDQNISTSSNTNSNANSFSLSANNNNTGSHLPDLTNPLDANICSPAPPQLTSLTLEVSSARRFIVNRLGALQQSLPPRPIGVALALVRAIWFNYDSADERLRNLHWMNTMVNSGLQTLFG